MKCFRFGLLQIFSILAELQRSFLQLKFEKLCDNVLVTFVLIDTIH